MSSINKSRMQTVLTISIEAKRLLLVSQLMIALGQLKPQPIAKKSEIVSPGHVFPLVQEMVVSWKESINRGLSVISKLSNQIQFSNL